MSQSLTLLSAGDPRFAPVASWDRSRRLQWVVVTAQAFAGPYSVYGDYRSLRQARDAAAAAPGPAFVNVLQVTLGQVYIYSGPLKGR